MGDLNRWPLVAVVAVGIFLLMIFLLGGEEPAPPAQPVADGSVLQSLVPDSPIAADDCLLQWTPGPDGSTYRLTLMTEASRTLATWEGLDQPKHWIPKGVLLPVLGDTLVWRVDVLQTEGETPHSATFSTAIRRE